MHRIHLEHIPFHVGEVVEVHGDEARHAAGSKRLSGGDAAVLFDGRGRVARCVVTAEHPGGSRKKSINLSIRELLTIPRVRPIVHVVASTPKGSRVDELVDGLSQVGAASWRPLRSDRTIVDPRASKLARIERIAVESAKQCGRAWVLEIMDPVDLADVLADHSDRRTDPSQPLIIADPAAPDFSRASIGPAQVCPDECTLLIGPEGGFTDEERDQALRAGGIAARFGPHTMRIETAAIVSAAAVILAWGAPPTTTSASDR